MALMSRDYYEFLRRKVIASLSTYVMRFQSVGDLCLVLSVLVHSTSFVSGKCLRKRLSSSESEGTMYVQISKIGNFRLWKSAHCWVVLHIFLWVSSQKPAFRRFKQNCENFAECQCHFFELYEIAMHSGS